MMTLDFRRTTNAFLAQWHCRYLKIGPAAVEAVPALAATLNDRDKVVRRRAGRHARHLLAGRLVHPPREWILFVVTKDHPMISWAGNQQ
jgi:hypothetical protein